MELDRRTLLATLTCVLAGGDLLQAQDLPSALLDPTHARLEAGPAGDNRVYFEGSTGGLKSLVVGSFALKPAQQPHPPHSHADEEIMAICAGTGEIVMNAKSSEVGPGTVMYAAPFCLHGVRNTGSAPLTFYYFKWIAKAAIS
jgi:mannose-6-phosphate isomerase-like protein (cupin superfamily)